MIRQEACEEPFLEEEVEEAVLHKLGWRAEAKVQRAVVARGGIVADQVGYGKTAISLGLINCDIAKARTEIQPPKKGDPCDLVHGRIPTRATLVVAPAHLMKQWPSELAKFCGSSLKAVSIQTMADLNKKTIRDIMQADIVFVAVTVFRGGTYIYKDTPNTPRLTILQHSTSTVYVLSRVHQEDCRPKRGGCLRVCMRRSIGVSASASWNSLRTERKE